MKFLILNKATCFKNSKKKMKKKSTIEILKILKLTGFSHSPAENKNIYLS